MCGRVESSTRDCTALAAETHNYCYSCDTVSNFFILTAFMFQYQHLEHSDDAQLAAVVFFG